MMKIATWNIARPHGRTKRLMPIVKQIKAIDADILVLTETMNDLPVEGYKSEHSLAPEEDYFKPNEVRVSIYSRYPLIKQINSWNERSSLCWTVMTPLGELAVYGTIIGNNGLRRNDYLPSLKAQLDDIKRISNDYPVCYVGDYNISLDSYYTNDKYRTILIDALHDMQVENYTFGITNLIDHIAISKDFVGTRRWESEVWNAPPDLKLYSDHVGVVLKID